MASNHGHITFSKSFYLSNYLCSSFQAEILLQATTVALIASAIFILTILSIAALAYLRSQKPLVQSITPHSSAEPLDSYTLYQYDPKRGHPAMFLNVSLMVPLGSELGVQMMQVIVTPPTPMLFSAHVFQHFVSSQLHN